MKLLVFTDIHGSQKALKSIASLYKKRKPDVLVCCGDISVFEANLAKILGLLNSLGKPVIVVNGNHESERGMARICRRFPNIDFIHGSHFFFGNALFLGYGGDGFSIVDPHFAEIAKSFEEIIRVDRGKKVILVTHAPPYGTKIDRVLGNQCGNKSIRQFIEKHRPAYAFCGHIHETFGKRDRIGKTIVVNPGPLGKIVKV